MAICVSCHILTEHWVVDLEHLTIDDQLKGEYNMALIEKTEHVDIFFVILIICDEFHFEVECNALIDMLQTFLPHYCQNHPNHIKWENIMSDTYL